MLVQPTCPGESGQELARRSHMSGKGECWAGGERWGADEFCMQEIREVSSTAAPEQEQMFVRACATSVLLLVKLLGCGR